MSNYIKAVDFASKDTLVTGNPLKIIKGTEINDEFNAIATAVATKADLTSPNLLGNPTTTTQTFGNSSTRIATTEFVQQALQALYPVGVIYTSIISTNPSSIFGFGTWVAFATGRMLIGIDSSDANMNVAEETGGSKDAVVVSHNHTATSVVTDPGHRHGIVVAGDDAGGAATVDGAVLSSTTLFTAFASTGVTVATTNTAAGVSGTNANLPPYIAVYIWKRTS